MISCGGYTYGFERCVCKVRCLHLIMQPWFGIIATVSMVRFFDDPYMVRSGRWAHTTRAIRGRVSEQFVSLFTSPLQQFVAESKYIGTRQRSHRSSHAMPCKLFADVEERERGERKRPLLRETTTSWAKETLRDNFTTIVWVVVAIQLIIFFFTYTN
jgi:hypothetical protein